MHTTLFVIVISIEKSFFLIGGKLLYNVVFVSVIKCKSVIILYTYIQIYIYIYLYIYIYINTSSLLSLPTLPPSQPSRSSQSLRLGPLCYIAASLEPSLSLRVVSICQHYFLNLPHPLTPLLCPRAHSLHVCLHSFPAVHQYCFSRSHIYVLIYNISFLWLSNAPLYMYHIFIPSSIDGHIGFFHCK